MKISEKAIDAAMEAHWDAGEKGVSDRSCMLLAIDAAIQAMKDEESEVAESLEKDAPFGGY